MERIISYCNGLILVLHHSGKPFDKLRAHPESKNQILESFYSPG